MTDVADPLEQAVIGGALLSGGKVPPEVLAVEPEHFTSERHGTIWAAILELLEERQPVDEITTHCKLKSWGVTDSAYLFELTDDTPTIVNLDIWARRLSEAGRKRLYDARMTAALTGNANTDEMLARVQEVAAEARKHEGTAGLVHIREPLKALYRELEEECQNPGTQRIAKTGLPDLDRATEMRAGHLTIIAGRPGMGKSALAGNISQNCARSPLGSVALFSLEMDAVSLIRRMVAAQAKVDSGDLVHAIKTHGDLVAEAFNKLHGLSLYVDDRPNLSVTDMRAALARLPDVRLVVVDYLQLSKMDSRLERHDLRVGAVTKGLKALAKDFKCHVIALSQLNREVEKRKPPIPCMADLRDSGNIEEDAENVWLLYREGYYNTKADKREAQIIIGKARHGKTGAVDVLWNAERQQFYQLEGRA